MTKPAHIRTGNTCSLLDISRFCPAAAKLSGKYGSGRAAAVGRAVHAQFAEEEEATRLFMTLTSDEQDVVRNAKKPTPVVLGKVTLDYASSIKETWVGLDEDGFYQEVKDNERIMLVGRSDFHWIAESEGERWLYIADLKPSKWTAKPDSLQLHAYGRALALANDCVGYISGIWAYIDGEWIWSRDAIRLDSDEAIELWQTIVHAATNVSGQACRGPHCKKCWSAQHCPEWTVAAIASTTELAALAEDSELLTPANALKALRWCETADKLSKHVKECVKTLVKGGLVNIISEDGSEKYAAIGTKGREGWDEEKLSAHLGKDRALYRKTGAPSVKVDWLKNRGDA